MAMLRKSSLDQLVKINKIIGKNDGGVKKSFTNMSNLILVHDPINSHITKKQKLLTYDDFYKTDMSKSIKKEKKLKNESNIMNDVIKFSKMFENESNDSPTDIMKNMKTIRDMVSIDSPKKGMSVGLVGRPIQTDDVVGIINRIEGEYIYIDSTIEPYGVIKIKLKDILKPSKKKEPEQPEMSFSITGAIVNNTTKIPKVDNYQPKKLNDVAKKSKDQKISDTINIIKNIKSFSDLSKKVDNSKFWKK